MATAGDDIPGKSDGCTSEDLVDEPLDKRKIEVTKDGRKIMVPAINIGFMEKRQFVHYKPLVSFNITKSEDETLTAGEEEWLERISFLEDDLHWLLKLSHQRFWSQVVFDEGLQQCLESFLTFAPREYDLRENGREDLFSVLRKVHKLVFFVFLRMSTYKESKMDHMTSSGFGTIIYDNFLFDIPKMMDLCALYGSQNKVLLMKMISNIFDVQPKYSSDLVAVVPNLFSVFDNVEMKLGLHLTSEEENQRPIKLGEERIPCISSMSLPSLLDIAHYIMDSSVTLNSFLEVYLPGYNILFKYGFTTRIASFYNRVFPAIERELKARIRKQEETFQIIEEMRLKLGLAKTHWIRMFRNFISSSCLQPIIESRCESINGIGASQSSHLEELMKIFTEVVSEKCFICDYNSLFPFDSDVEILSEADISLDPTRLDYIFNGIHQNEEDAIDKNCNLMPSNSTSDSISKSSMKNGLKTEEITNLQGLASALADMKPVASNRDSNFQNYGDTASAACPLSDLQMNSLIKTVLDLLPDYGPGFIEECLKCYEFSSEKVIDALLQKNLPENLKMLDPTLQRKIIANNIDSSSNYIPPTLLSERRNVFDYDEFDVFNREDVNMEKIHQGKRDKTPQEYEGLSNGKNDDSSFLKEAALNYSAVSNFCDEVLDLYDDEYDDTYDSVMIGIDEKQTEKELQSLRPFTTPRVLEQWKRREQEVEEVSHVGREEGDEKILPPKRDEFVPNPEILRERAEQRRQEKIAARGRHHPSRNFGNASGGNGNQTQNRQQKEKHKSRIANHSRRNQSDWKKSRGMVPFPTR